MAVMRIVPVGFSPISLTAAISASISSSRGPTVCISRSPASVGETLRVVRVSSRTPRRVSSARMVWLSADWEIPSLAAARVKLRSCATARNASRSLMFSRGMRALGSGPGFYEPRIHGPRSWRHAAGRRRDRPARPYIRSMLPSSSSQRQSWHAVGSMAMCVALLIASEFMPVSLLTPIAHDLHATEGMAGQSISISGLFAVVTSLLIATIAGRFVRRYVLMGLTGLMLFSLMLIAEAPNLVMLMVARALLGIVI